MTRFIPRSQSFINPFNLTFHLDLNLLDVIMLIHELMIVSLSLDLNHLFLLGHGIDIYHLPLDLDYFLQLGDMDMRFMISSITVIFSSMFGLDTDIFVRDSVTSRYGGVTGGDGTNPINLMSRGRGLDSSDKRGGLDSR
jgi:hypothetical protein